MASRARVTAYHRGHRGEFLAAWFLRLKLYRILETRFKTPVGEIDLIGERFGTIVFVEVKARSSLSGEVEALGAVNRQRIVHAAQYWAAKNPKRAQSDMRFDVIFVAPKSMPRHLVNAFSL